MFELVFHLLRAKFDPDSRIHILRSSQDPGLADYFEFMSATGSTDMDPEGHIFVKLHDVHGVDKLTWLEEFAHALQLLKDGPIALSYDDTERKIRELEVAHCLLENSVRFRLSQTEQDDCRQRMLFFGGAKSW